LERDQLIEGKVTDHLWRFFNTGPQWTGSSVLKKRVLGTAAKTSVFAVERVIAQRRLTVSQQWRCRGHTPAATANSISVGESISMEIAWPALKFDQCPQCRDDRDNLDSLIKFRLRARRQATRHDSFQGKRHCLSTLQTRSMSFNVKAADRCSRSVTFKSGSAAVCKSLVESRRSSFGLYAC